MVSLCGCTVELFYWAKEIEEGKPYEERTEELRDTKYWHRHKGWSEKAALIAFGVGVLVSALYIAVRAFVP